MGPTEQRESKAVAMGLLDALTLSGGLPLEHAQLHVIVAATHTFDKSVTETVVRDNVNPLDRVERSTLILASTVHGVPPKALLRPSELPRVSRASPILFEEPQLRPGEEGGGSAPGRGVVA